MAAVTHGIATASTSQASSYASAAFTPAANDLLVVFVVASGTAAGGSCSDNQSGTYTKIDSATKNGSADTLYLFIRNTLTTAVSHTVTFDCSGDNATGAIVMVARVSGMSQTGLAASRQTAKQSNVTGPSAPAPSFASACLTGNPTLGVVGNGANPAAITPPTNWTERADTGYNTPATGGEYASRDSGFTGTTITWGTATVLAYGDIIVELDTSIPAINGSGALTAPAGTLSGAGDVDISGNGTLTTPVATQSGSGEVIVSGSGTLTVLSGELSGTGTVGDVISGSGALAAQTAVLAGTGAVEVSVNGALFVAVALISGAGTVGSEEPAGTPHPMWTWFFTRRR